MNDKDTYRMHTKVIQIGDRKIGGGNPIAIQSMTNTKTEDVRAAQGLSLAACVPVTATGKGRLRDHPLYGTYLRGGSSHP